MRITPLLTVDCVLFEGSKVILIRRKKDPFRDRYALPGGFVEVGETVEQACRREMKEETGISICRLHLIGVYSKPERDPRQHSVSVAYLGFGDASKFCAGDDAESVCLVNWADLELAFDHNDIVRDAHTLLQKLSQ